MAQLTQEADQSEAFQCGQVTLVTAAIGPSHIADSEGHVPASQAFDRQRGSAVVWRRLHVQKLLGVPVDVDVVYFLWKTLKIRMDFCPFQRQFDHVVLRLHVARQEHIITLNSQDSMWWPDHPRLTWKAGESWEICDDFTPFLVPDGLYLRRSWRREAAKWGGRWSGGSKSWSSQKWAACSKTV